MLNSEVSTANDSYIIMYYVDGNRRTAYLFSETLVQYLAERLEERIFYFVKVEAADV